MVAVSVIGLGKLGACTAACLAYKGFRVIGVDVNKRVVDAVNAGNAYLKEPRLQELIDQARDRLRATTDYAEAFRETDMSMLIVPTPSQEDGGFSDRYLVEGLQGLGLAFRESKKEYHLFVVTSTVSPGTCDGRMIPLIESISSKKLGDDFGFCYNPEFIALGSVIHDTLAPDMVLIGESDTRSGDILNSIYEEMCENEPYIARMSLISAEIAKISLNAFVTMKISFANLLGNICEAMPGADVDAITRAIGADTRVSPHYLKAGLGFGGPCFPRDNRAFMAFARGHGTDALLAKSTDEVNARQEELLVKRVLDCLPAGGTVGVLGISYKPNTSVIDESPGIHLVERLLQIGISVIVYDPLAMENTRAVFGSRIRYAESVEECVSEADVSVITTQCEKFKVLEILQDMSHKNTVIDCWRMLVPEKIRAWARYLAVGQHSSDHMGEY